MRPRDLIPATVAVWESGNNTFWHGKPGCGKTHTTVDAVRALPNSLLYKFPPAVTIEPFESGGLPYIQDGKQMRARPDIWPTDEECAPYEWVVCFIDELPQGTPGFQASLMQAVWGHQVGKHIIPANVVFHACGNRQEDRAGVNRILTPLLDRFFHFDFDTSRDDWLDWAVHNGVAEDVRALIAFRPELLSNFDPKANERAFATPRGWHQVSDVLPKVREDLLHMTISGKVGPGAAAEFIAFRQVRRDLPTDRSTIYKSPKTAPIPMDKPVTIYALALAIAEDSKEMKDLDPVAIYCSRFPKEMSAFAFREVFAANCQRLPNGNLKASEKLSKREMVRWTKEHKDIILASAS